MSVTGQTSQTSKFKGVNLVGAVSSPGSFFNQLHNIVEARCRIWERKNNPNYEKDEASFRKELLKWLK